KAIVEQKVGKAAILNLAAEKAIQEHYPKLVEKDELDVIGAPQIKILKLKESDDLEYVATTAVMPEVVLKDWQSGIKKINKKYRDKKIEIAEEEIESELSKLANSRTKLVTVNRKAQKDDAVKVDFQVRKDGVVIEGGSAKDHSLILGKNVFIPGFEEEIVGMKEGEEKTFELVFPKEYHEKNLAGQPAQFTVKLNLVQERVVPDVDDEFAKSLGKFESLEDLKKSIKTGLKKEKEMQQKSEQRDLLVEELLAKMEVEIPEILIHEEIHRMLHEFEDQVRGMGLTTEQYLEQIGKTKDDLEKDWRPQAEKRIRASLALSELIKDKELEIDNEKIEEEMNKVLQFYKNEKQALDNLDMQGLYEHTKAMLLNEEVFKVLEKM
ncbi:MAG TPA: trigger factor, partial [Candidatus Moranbacteria bacterium]|nr:trigger factor [Candidatus Moranbacteria bacterium]